MFTLPGTPVLRYGDELGMGDDLKLPERNCARTPMQWSNEPHGGFTKSDKPHIPVISGGPYGFEHINAAIQRRHPDSLLNWTERIIRMRKEVPEIGWGDFAVIPTRDPAVLVMRYDWRNNWVCFLCTISMLSRARSRFPSGSRGSMPSTATSWSICWGKSTATPTRTAGIGSSSRATTTDGTASAV
jgi:maltose alpha-D-glucosyltransferase/alpha-amylase